MTGSERQRAEPVAEPLSTVPVPARRPSGISNLALARLASRAAGATAEQRLPDPVAAGIDATRGQGGTLPTGLRTDMEAAFGRDFSSVGLHRGADAGRLAASVEAVAFTTGSDIYLSAGVDPGSTHGREVLAHELTHVVQNADGVSVPTGAISRAGDPSERQAERIASAVAAGTVPNSSVLRMLGGGAPSGDKPAATPAGGAARYVRRWGSDEHQRLGDTTGLMIDIGGGVQLTFGQVVALAGDEFGSLDQLMEATSTPDGRAMIRAHLERAGLPPAHGAALPAPNKKQTDTAGTDYVLLAMENTSHFSAGGTAVQTWTEHHRAAVDLALRAGLDGDEGLLNKARFTEAFGAHYLTDAFSAGHVRVPRQQIADYYLHTVAPSVYDHLLGYLRRHLVDELYQQIAPQTSVDDVATGVFGPWYGGGWARGQIEGRINTAVVARLHEAITAAGGRDQAISYLGLGLAGIVCGALHDADNRDGLMVISAAHPDPWQAFGDGLLDRNTLHQQRAEEALAASVADLATAYDIGTAERLARHNVPDPTELPSTLYFDFNAAAVRAETQAAVERLALYLRYRPDTALILTGHTDPIGSDADNDSLGLMRAQAIESVLAADGIDRVRLFADSRGETNLVTTVAADYARNRRVEISYRTDAALAANPEPDDQAAARHAALIVAGRVGPPYSAERHIPQESPGIYADLPDWEWHAIAGRLEAEINKWVSGYLTQYRDKVLTAPELREQEVDGYTIQPRPIVEGLLARIAANPMEFLREALGP